MRAASTGAPLAGIDEASLAVIVSAGYGRHVLHSESPGLDGLEIALEGGQMGGEDFFKRLLHGNA